MTIFKDVTVTNPGTTPLGHVDVTITGDLVERIEPTGGSLPDDHAVVVGGFLAPSLTDHHVHFVHDPLANQVIGLRFLLHGITRVFCMNGFPGVLDLREQIAEGTAPGPRVWSTGPAHDDASLTYVGGQDAARSEARLGYDAIKVYNDVAMEGWRGLLAGARETGLPVVGHVARDPGLTTTLDSAQSHIAHVEELLYTAFDVNLEELLDSDCDPISSAKVAGLAERLLATGQSVGTTIEALAAAAEQVSDIDAWCSREEFLSLPLLLREQWGPRNNYYTHQFQDPRHPKAMRRLLALNISLAMQLLEHGVPLVVASDALNCGVEPGGSFFREVGHLSGAGMSMDLILESAMRDPLDPADAPPRRIAVGGQAELVHTDSSLFEARNGLPPVRGVVAMGAWLSRERLVQLISELTQLSDSHVQEGASS